MRINVYPGRVYPGRPVQQKPPSLRQLRPPYDSLMRIGRSQPPDPKLETDSLNLVDRSRHFGRQIAPPLTHTLLKRFFQR